MGGRARRGVTALREGSFGVLRSPLRTASRLFFPLARWRADNTAGRSCQGWWGALAFHRWWGGPSLSVRGPLNCEGATWVCVLQRQVPACSADLFCGGGSHDTHADTPDSVFFLLRSCGGAHILTAPTAGGGLARAPRHVSRTPGSHPRAHRPH